MGSKTIAIIACDHGLGHIRRCTLLGYTLANIGWEVHLYAHTKSVEKIATSFSLGLNVELHEFRTQTNVDNFREKFPYDWVAELPDMKSYDLVLSDNLLEILRIRSDAVICGSFLWHNAVDGISVSYKKEMERLLEKYKPVIITPQLFALNNVDLQFAKIHLVGLHAFKVVPDVIDKADLLISCGMSKEVEEEFKDFIERLAKYPKTPFNMVWVEPRLLPYTKPEWMKPATFDPKMFSNLSAVICRPGVGTLTDCLSYGARIFSYHEPGNYEMSNNSKAIVFNNVGEKCDSLHGAYQSVCAFFADKSKKSLHSKTVSRISCSGINDTVRVLEELRSGSCKLK